MDSKTTLECPKCRGEMHSYERNGVLIDQCVECRGVFLDRGELELLLDAESRSQRTAGHDLSRYFTSRGDRHDSHNGDHDKHDGDHNDRRIDMDHDERYGGRRGRSRHLFEGLFGGGD